MFFRQKDILDKTAQKKQQRKVEKKLNSEVELSVNANSFINQVFPQSGSLELGDAGVEFVSFSGAGFVQIPWESIVRVRVDVLGKKHVRAVTIETDETKPLEFIISNGREVVRVMANHLSREKLVRGPENFKSIGKSIGGWFKKRGNKEDV